MITCKLLDRRQIIFLYLLTAPQLGTALPAIMQLAVTLSCNAEPRTPPSKMQLANILSTEALFYACILPFIAFFGSFAFFMYPLREVLHPTGVRTWRSLPTRP